MQCTIGPTIAILSLAILVLYPLSAGPMVFLADWEAGRVVYKAIYWPLRLLPDLPGNPLGRWVNFWMETLP